ncbi:MAG: RHS repeat protein, partial [Lentisphaeria bacterium]|nr:RHS repeat protein [Lentisphaeria bacterium]
GGQPAENGTVFFADTTVAHDAVVVYHSLALPEGCTDTFGSLTILDGASLTLGGGAAVTILGALRLEGNATLVCRGRNATGQVGGEWVGQGVEIRAGEVSVAAGAWITADGQGYQPVAAAPGNGPGGGWGAWGTIGHGAGHGGAGGGQAPGYGLAYGSADEPVDLGSAGGGLQDGGLGGAGGGAIRLVVTGTLTLDGRISANATAPSGAWYPGGGAGGSIWITADRLSGAGVLQANGSAGGLYTTGGGGGGGRIAVYYGEDGGFGGFTTATAAAGTGGAGNQQPGTIAFVCTAGGANHLFVYQDYVIPEGSSPSYAALTVDVGGRLGIGGGATVTVDGLLHLTGNATVLCRGQGANGRVEGQWAGGGVAIHAGDITIDSGSALSADGLGYAAAPAAPGNGPGAGWGENGTIARGAGHGGHGACEVYGYGETYGSAVYPVDLGSSGGGCQDGGLGGPGGGAILLQVADTLTVDGTLSANAGPVSVAWYPGGGAGGSICVNARSVVGTGTISANGGAGGIVYAGKGGGGRVAVHWWDRMTLPDSRITVEPGDDGNPDWPAEAGSRVLSNTPQFLVLQPDQGQVHDTEVVRWVALATDVSALTVDLAASCAGSGAAVAIGTGLPALGQTTWNTTPAADGLYELRATFRDGAGAVVGEAFRTVIVNNAAAWHAGRIETDQTWAADRVHVVEGNVSLAPGVRLTVEPGAVVKFAARLMLTVEAGAILEALGSVDAPILFTSLADDAAGGDTNADGNLTLPHPGDWLGVAVQATGQFLTNAFVAIRYIATVHSGMLATDEAWPGDAVHHLTGDLIVPNNVTLTLSAGAVVKLAVGKSLIVQTGGTLIVAGNAAQPVVITSERDDSVGGDTNGDGSNTHPAPGDWYRIHVDGGVADLRHAQIRYGSGIDSVSAGLIRTTGAAQVTVDNSFLADGLYTGILAWGGTVTLTNTVVAGLDRGVSAHPGSPVSVIHCTLDRNRIGLLVHGGSLTAVNSIVSNALVSGVQYDFGTLAGVTYCDVWSGAGAGYVDYLNTTDLTGTAGNISADPRYKDAARRNFRLDYSSPCIDAADGTVAPAADLAGAPRYNDPRTPDTGVPMPARGEAAAVPDMGAFEFVESAVSDVDLVVTAVIGPPEATAGETVTLQWTVTNLGIAAANGPWHDTVYLVRDPETSPVAIPAGEVLAGQGTQLGPGQSVVVYGQVRVPGSTATPHRWQVSTNARGEVFEGQNADNNSARSAALVTLALPPLALAGDPVNGQFAAVGDAHWFAFTPEAGQDVLVSLDLAGSGATELYIGFGRMPSRQDYDVASTQWNSADVSALVAAAGGQTCYVLAYAAALGGTPMAFSLRAEALEFSLTTVWPTQCGRGPVTFRVGGGQLREDMAYRLAGAARAAHAATAVFLVNPALVYVTFDLGSAGTGAYRLEVEWEGAVRTLPAAVNVTDSAPGWTEYSIEVPAATRPGWVESLTIHYRNPGSTDVLAPLLHFVVAGAEPPDHDGHVSPISHAKAPPPVYMARYLLGVNPEGPAGVLPPGVAGSFAVEIDPAVNTGAVEYQLRAVTDPTLPVDWAGMIAAAKPQFIDDEAWAAVCASYQALIGITVGEFQQAMARQATYLSRLGERVSSVSDLSYLALAEAGMGQIAPRYALGAMGRGRTHPYDIWGEVKGNRVLLHYPPTRTRQFTPLSLPAEGEDETRYAGVPGDRGVLVASAAAGTWTLTEPEGGVMVFAPDGADPSRQRLACCEDRNGNHTTLEYAAGQVTRVLFADGLATTYEYNAAGRLVTITDPFGLSSTLAYDAANEHLTGVTSQGMTTTYAYVSGQGPATEHALASIALPDGRLVEFEYDSLGRVVRTSEAVSGWEQTVAYGPGPRQVVTGPDGNATEMLYNRFGQLGQAIGPLGDGPRFAYDGAHNLVGLSGPGGVRCSMAYDAAGQRTALVHGSGGQMGADFGAFGLLERLVDPLGRVTAFERDARGNLLSTTYPDGSRALQTVDAHGELVTTTNRRGQTTRYQRDAQRRLSRVEYADATALEYTYDSQYRQTAAAGPAGTIAMTYDGANRVTDVDFPGGRSLHYTYDSLGRRTGMADQDGFEVSYAYDDAGRLAGISTGAGQVLMSYTYDVNGRLTREERGNGTYSTYAYDAAGRLTLLVHATADGTALARFAYGYDAAGRRARVETAEGTWHCTYDGRSQLTQAVLPSGRTIQYAYDLAGNRTTVSDDGVATSYAANTLDQYVSVGGAARQHDADGNLTGSTAAGGRTYAYDSQGRLTAAGAGASVWNWEYDALGNRVAMTESGQRTEYLVDPTGIGTLVAEYDAGGNLLARYVHGLGPVCRIDASGEIAFYGFDGNANAALLTGPDGSALNRYEYLPFGEPLLCDETVPNPFRFAGRQGVLTDSSGLVHMRQRWYEPAAGRFLQPDPIGPFGGNANLYTYAGNAPTLFTDPMGLYMNMGDMLLGEFGMGILNSALNAEYGYFSPSPDYDRINAEIASHSQNHHYLQNVQHLFGPDGLVTSGYFTQQELQSTAVQSGLLAHVLTGVSVNYAIHHFQSNFQGSQALAPYTYCQVSNGYTNFGTTTPPPGSAAAAAYAQNQDVFNQFVLNHCHNPSPDRPLAPCLTLPLDHPYGGRSPLDCPTCPGGERSPPFPGIISMGDVCVLPPVITGQIPVVTALDPNDIQGPAGVGAAAWIAIEPMGYTIRFENRPDAAAPAQRVEVTLTLAADTDWSTFELGNAGFGNVYIPLPAGLQSYSARVDLRHTFELYVDVTAGLDPATGVVTWTFTSIDPVTGQPTRDPLAGFLPPNLTPPEGEGYVRYSVQPLAGAATGTVIQARAGIVFDTNEPILTNTAQNTLDAEAPTEVSLSALRRGDGSLIEMTLAGDDGGGSGVASFDLYAAVDGGPFLLWTTLETAAATFDGEWGCRYEFAAVARDAVGHVMPLSRGADADLRVPQWALRLDAAEATPPAVYLGTDTLASTGFDPLFDEDAPAPVPALGALALVGSDPDHKRLLY